MPHPPRPTPPNLSVSSGLHGEAKPFAGDNLSPSRGGSPCGSRRVASLRRPQQARALAAHPEPSPQRHSPRHQSDAQPARHIYEAQEACLPTARPPAAPTGCARYYPWVTVPSYTSPASHQSPAALSLGRPQAATRRFERLVQFRYLIIRGEGLPSSWPARRSRSRFEAARTALPRATGRSLLQSTRTPIKRSSSREGGSRRRSNLDFPVCRDRRAHTLSRRLARDDRPISAIAVQRRHIDLDATGGQGASDPKIRRSPGRSRSG